MGGNCQRKKVRERGLKWYGPFIRREEPSVGRRVMGIEVIGRSPRKLGRPERSWLDRVRDDISKKGLSRVEVYDRAACRRMCRANFINHDARFAITEERRIDTINFQRNCMVTISNNTLDN